MSDDEVLYRTDWLELRKTHFKQLDVDYIYCHATKTKGQAVAILPFRHDEKGPEFLLRREIVPPWDSEQHSVCAMTGGHDQDSPSDTAIKELYEEGGYSVSDKASYIDLGTCRTGKASDTVHYLFAIDLTTYEGGDAAGDGTPLEAVAESFWASTSELIESPDPLLHIMYNRLEVK